MEIKYMNGEMVFIERRHSLDGRTYLSPGAVHVVKCADLARSLRRLLKAAGESPECKDTQDALFCLILSINLHCRRKVPSCEVPVSIVEEEKVEFNDPGTKRKRVPSIRAAKGRQPAGMTVLRGGLYSPPVRVDPGMLGGEFGAWKDSKRGDRG